MDIVEELLADHLKRIAGRGLGQFTNAVTVGAEDFDPADAAVGILVEFHIRGRVRRDIDDARGATNA